MSATRTHGAQPPRLRVAAAVLRDGDLVLLTRRPPGGAFGLFWEFPGGKIEPGESAEHALVRELHEELGVTVRPLELLAIETHDYPEGPEVEIHFLHCELESRDFRPSPAVHELRWARPSEVDPATLLAADRAFLAGLAAGRPPAPPSDGGHRGDRR